MKLAKGHDNKVHIFCNFSWQTNEREYHNEWTVAHYCIRQRGHKDNHRCDCDARKGTARIARVAEKEAR